MSNFLKDDLTVALDEVDRVASRIVTIYRDLSAVAGDADAAKRLRAEAERREAALASYNQARMAHGQIPEVDDPELAHLQALWVKLRSLLTKATPEGSLALSLAELDHALRRTVAAARDLQPDDDIAAAMDQLVAERQPD
jgi:hypothetical protein